MWKAFKRDFKERFMNNETFKGIVYLVIAVMLFNPSLMIYALQVFLIYEGIRKVSVNRVKNALAKKKLEIERELEEEEQPLRGSSDQSFSVEKRPEGY